MSEDREFASDVVSGQEASALLGVSQRHLLTLFGQGKLVARRLTKRMWIFSKTSVLTLAREREQERNNDN